MHWPCGVTVSLCGGTVSLLCPSPSPLEGQLWRTRTVPPCSLQRRHLDAVPPPPRRRLGNSREGQGTCACCTTPATTDRTRALDSQEGPGDPGAESDPGTLGRDQRISTGAPEVVLDPEHEAHASLDHGKCSRQRKALAFLSPRGSGPAAAAVSSGPSPARPPATFHKGKGTHCPGPVTVRPGEEQAPRVTKPPGVCVPVGTRVARNPPARPPPCPPG